jgi:uncharacterized protein
MNPYTIIDKYYPENNALRNILVTHSASVSELCQSISARHPELHLDNTFLHEAAMLHDIGIFKTNAPGIECFGTEPYICHGYIGAQLLRDENLPRHARVCERHTGTGLTAIEIERQQLPLPHQDFLPETLEEQLICFSDKYFSKTHLDRRRTTEQTLHSLEKFGAEGLERFKKWISIFGPLD